jgi:hypothetical protein
VPGRFIFGFGRKSSSCQSGSRPPSRDVKFESGYHAQTGGQGDALKFGINPVHRKKVVEPRSCG